MPLQGPSNTGGAACGVTHTPCRPFRARFDSRTTFGGGRIDDSNGFRETLVGFSLGLAFVF